MSARASRHRVILTVTMLAVSAAAAATQSTAPGSRDGGTTPTSMPTGTGALAGVVLADQGGAPVRLAHVVLIGASTGTLRVTASDASGRFAFESLPADRYTVGASKLPYLGSVAGARRPARPGTAVPVADGTRVEGVTIHLPLGAAISGAITDETGAPAVGTTVGLMHRRLQGRQRVWMPAPGGMTTTDERGRYRVYGVPPGEYLVVATSFRGTSFVALADADVDAVLAGRQPAPMPATTPATTRAPIYFPGTARQDQAAPILVAAGDDRQQVDFQLAAVPTSMLEITLGSTDGRPPQEATTVTIDGSVLNPTGTRAMMRAAPGRPVRTSSLAPGFYRVVAREPGTGGRVGSTVIELTGVDQSVDVLLLPPLTLTGRLEFQGSAVAPALSGHRVPLRSLGAALGDLSEPVVRASDAQGVFTLTGLLAGEYVLGGALYFGATTESVTWALDAVTVDGADVTDLPWTVSPDQPPRDLVVRYTDRWQQLTGRLVDAAGAPAVDYTVMAFPTDRRYWVEGSRRIQTARPGADGAFRLGGPGPSTLPPGAYWLAVVADLARDEQYDPAFLSALAGSATEIAIGPGERRVQDLAIR